MTFVYGNIVSQPQSLDTNSIYVIIGLNILYKEYIQNKKKAISDNPLVSLAVKYSVAY